MSRRRCRMRCSPVTSWCSGHQSGAGWRWPVWAPAASGTQSNRVCTGIDTARVHRDQGGLAWGSRVRRQWTPPRIALMRRPDVRARQLRAVDRADRTDTAVVRPSWCPVTTAAASSNCSSRNLIRSPTCHRESSAHDVVWAHCAAPTAWISRQIEVDEHLGPTLDQLPVPACA